MENVITSFGIDGNVTKTEGDKGDGSGHDDGTGWGDGLSGVDNGSSDNTGCGECTGAICCYEGEPLNIIEE